MQTVEHKAGLCSMIESSLIERPQLGVSTVVLDVARHAVSGDIPVNTLLPGHPLRNRLMAHKALRRRYLLARGVTLQAVGDPLERRMGPRQAPRRHKSAQLR